VVGPSGKRLGSHVVETNARALIEVLRGIPRNRHVCLEEGTLSEWLHEVLEPHMEDQPRPVLSTKRGFVLPQMGLGRLELPTSRLSGDPTDVWIRARSP